MIYHFSRNETKQGAVIKQPTESLVMGVLELVVRRESSQEVQHNFGEEESLCVGFMADEDGVLRSFSAPEKQAHDFTVRH